ncbi:MAG TPA: type II toxin-antitoxin system HicB family antitoxin [Stellaceae bacterium]|nr:type II toxin-antitoxin system HicB family antitoxin [Stellaceae bacterium]
MAFGFRYTLEPEENGWWLVRFPDVPEALTEGETREEAHGYAADCLLAALEGYVKAGRPIPRPSSASRRNHRVTLPSLATAKLAVYETMRARGWSMTRLAEELNMSKDAARRLISLRHASPMAVIDKALAAMGAELAIELP